MSRSIKGAKCQNRAEATDVSEPTQLGQPRRPKSLGAAASSQTNHEKSNSQAALIVFGLDDAGKPHASWFAEADAELALKAAAMMGFQALPVTTPEMGAQALALPAGRLFASGRGFVPFAKMAAYEALSGFEGVISPPAPPAPEPKAAPVITGAPQTRADIGVGSVVLATTEGEAEGWFETVVVEDKSEGLFVLAWRDWPDLDPIVRRVDQIALLPRPTP